MGKNSKVTLTLGQEVSFTVTMTTGEKVAYQGVFDTVVTTLGATEDQDETIHIDLTGATRLPDIRRIGTAVATGGESDGLCVDCGRAFNHGQRFVVVAVDDNDEPAGVHVSCWSLREHEAARPDDEHEARPDDGPEPGDRCKECGKPVTWMGPTHLDWQHVDRS